MDVSWRTLGIAWAVMFAALLLIVVPFGMSGLWSLFALVLLAVTGLKLYRHVMASPSL